MIKLFEAKTIPFSYFARNASYFWYRKSWEYDWHDGIFWSHGNSKCRGVAICVSGKTGYKIYNTSCETNGRYVAINASVNDIDLSLVSLYGPNKNDHDFYDKFFESLNVHAKAEIMICGD